MKANKRVRDLARRVKNLITRTPKPIAKIATVSAKTAVVDEPVVRARTPAEELEHLFATYQKRGKV